MSSTTLTAAGKGVEVAKRKPRPLPAPSLHRERVRFANKHRVKRTNRFLLADSYWEKKRLGFATASANPTALLRTHLPVSHTAWEGFYLTYEDKHGRDGQERINRAAYALREAVPALTRQEAVDLAHFRYIDAPWEQQEVGVTLARLALPLGEKTGRWDGVRFLSANEQRALHCSVMLTLDGVPVWGVMLTTPHRLRSEQEMTILANAVRKDLFPVYPQMISLVLVSNDTPATGELVRAAWISPTDAGL